jgi:hypothetical protein
MNKARMNRDRQTRKSDGPVAILKNILPDHGSPLTGHMRLQRIS